MKQALLSSEIKKRKKRNRIILGLLFVFIILITISILSSNQNKDAITKNIQKEISIPASTNNGNEKVIALDSNQSDKAATSQDSATNVTAMKSDTSTSSDNSDLSKSSTVDNATELSSDDIQLPDEITLPEDAQNSIDSLMEAVDQAWRIKNQFSDTVAKGDTFSSIVSQSGIDDANIAAIVAQFPNLKNLSEGEQFYWTVTKDGELDYLDWQVSEREDCIYTRQADGQYKEQTIKSKSVWKTDIIQGEINGSLNQSLSAKNVSSRQALQLNKALQWQISLNKLHKGDKFAIMVRREYLDGKPTDIGNVEAIHLVHAGTSYYAIQAPNGKYYNARGETIGRGFARYPLARTPRISSNFNPHRRNPVTGRVSPHNGTDFAIPIGTPIIAPADGKVLRVAYQAHGAGNYLVLQHGQTYRTVYMHLSKVLVKVGQSIRRGQRIALSGNTGRSTGPHLHYEFRINNRPVNAMTVSLPGMNNTMSSSERKKFLAYAKTVVTKLKI